MPVSIDSTKNYIGKRLAFARSWISIAVSMGFLTISCANASTPMKINVDRIPADSYVTHWLLLGPFVLASTSDPAAITAGEQHDYLSDIGFREMSFTPADLKILSKSHQIYRSYEATSALVDLESAYPQSDHAEVYAVAELRNKKDADIGIELGSQDALTLWVNGQLIMTSIGGSNHFAIPYDHYGIAHLQRGRNILVAKINRQIDGGNFLLNFIGAAHARDAMRHRLSGLIVEPILLHSGDPIQITIPPACLEPLTEITIHNNVGDTVFSKNASPEELHAVPLPVVTDGYYSLTASSLCGSLDDSVYIGDTATAYNNIVTLRNTNPPTSREYLSLDAIAQRYESLTSAAYSHPTVRSWQMKLIMVLKDGSRAITDSDGQQWSREPGLHLREYKSSIDGTYRHYLICIPDSYQIPAPLVLEFPPLLATVRPLLEGGLLSSMDDLNHLKQAADESHVFVVRLGDRGNLLDTPMAEGEFFEVLSDVESEFNVEKRQVYLLGYSEAGRRSLLLAEHYPSLFAGIGTYGALTEAYEGDASHEKWIRDNSVSSIIKNLRNVPVITINGDRDLYQTVESARELYSTLLDNGVPAEFHIFRYGIHSQPYTENVIIPLLMRSSVPPPVHIDYVFPFLNHTTEDWIQVKSRGDRQQAMKLKADRHGTDISIQSSNVTSLCVNFGRLTYTMGQAVNVDWNGHNTTIHAEAGCVSIQFGASTRQDDINTISDGTLAEAVAEPFLIVVGTNADSEESSEVTSNAFISMWKSEFFVTPRFKRDIDVTPDDIQKYNLVLIGEPTNGSILSVANTLTARVKSEMLSLPEAQHSGAITQEAFAVPNPLNVKRSLVCLNVTANLIDSHEFDPVFTGFYDYAIWDSTGTRIKTGVFSQAEVDSLLTDVARAGSAPD